MKTRSRERMPSTGSIESVTTRRGSKRNKGRTSTAAATLGMTTRSMARAQLESQSAARAKIGEGDGCSKRTKLDGVSQRVSPEAEGPNLQDSMEMEDEDWEQEYEEDCDCFNWDDYYDPSPSPSSAVSSPVRFPYMTQEQTTGDSEVAKKYKDLYQSFCQKIHRQHQLVTLCADAPQNCLVDDPTLLHIREPARKAVVRAGQFVVGLSSSIDGQPLARSSGFMIHLGNEKGTGIIVTTALLIRTKHPAKNAWACRDQYACDAKVDIHWRGCIPVEGELLYYQKHYNLAFFRSKVDPSAQLPSYSDNPKCGQDIFELGRDENYKLLINHGRVEYSNPTKFERHHHMYIQGPQRDRTYDKGGPVIDLDGKVVGMIDNCSAGSFIPSSILLKCFHLWKSFRCIPRPHLGLQFNTISLQNPADVENIWFDCRIDEGLVVEEVSEDSPAEKCGIRIGDVIECLNGKIISSTVELENMLLSIMENSEDGLKSDLDLEIQVYCTRRKVRRVKFLTVNVSDDAEFVRIGSRLVR